MGLIKDFVVKINKQETGYMFTINKSFKHLIIKFLKVFNHKNIIEVFKIRYGYEGVP